MIWHSLKYEKKTVSMAEGKRRHKTHSRCNGASKRKSAELLYENLETSDIQESIRGLPTISWNNFLFCFLSSFFFFCFFYTKN